MLVATIESEFLNLKSELLKPIRFQSAFHTKTTQKQNASKVMLTQRKRNERESVNKIHRDKYLKTSKWKW